MRLPSLKMLYDYAAASPDRRALALFTVAVLTIGGAWFVELGLGYLPCKLCLQQRWPYYAALPLAALAWFIAGPMQLPRAARPAFAALGAIFMVSAALGAYHAGVEWGWWTGPADCGGRMGETPTSVNDLMAAIDRTRIVSCTEATFKIIGFSLAGWNALISFILATIAIRGWRRARWH
ncbi:MAG: disulfide bond formation protein B [Beijerinckiaceae bacterium]